MNAEQEGVKPQLALVETDQTPVEVETYADKLLATVQMMTACQAKKQKINPHEFITHLDAAEDNALVRDWMASNSVMTRSAFDRALNKATRDRRVRDELGFLPKDALDFVQQYAEARKITLTPRGTIKRSREYSVGDGAVVTALNQDTSAETRLIYAIANAEGDNLDSLARELRLIVDRLDLGYRDTVVADALATWQEDVVRRNKVQALLSIQFAKGKATGEPGTAMWAAMERACFDVSATQPGFAIAVVRKFMWQVKRKASGLPVTNHLMPVLTGAQGKGKTQFVTAMTLPLRDLMREVDFGMLTDGKTQDIWSSLILFIDEMGHFSSADVDRVKNVITAENVSIRTMRSNNSAPIRNAATLIGCTNSSLALLIRDDTGVRRFAELMWRNDPDWEASNAIDWTLLWQSVDEHGPDPMVEAGMMDLLREQQEANRNQNPVEVWARDYAHTYDKWTRASDIHVSYRAWEDTAFPRQQTSQTMFGKRLTHLISNMTDFPLEKQQGRNGISYRYRK